MTKPSWNNKQWQGGIITEEKTHSKMPPESTWMSENLSEQNHLKIINFGGLIAKQYVVSFPLVC
jgi:hypothetical protein